uniref:Uncharacterized protein n=1 Tax=Oryza sativa subsp. japonica TaxID=39947 RepID=Q2R0X4_ORYSJ|nr:hypothetical protein LOC_Os11g41090 [Oryza sativa Japonica Group]
MTMTPVRTNPDDGDDDWAATTSGLPDPAGGGGRERRDDDPNDDPDDWAATGWRRGPRLSRIRRRRASSRLDPAVVGLVPLGSGESGGGRRW